MSNLRSPACTAIAYSALALMFVWSKCLSAAEYASKPLPISATAVGSDLQGGLCFLDSGDRALKHIDAAGNVTVQIQDSELPARQTMFGGFARSFVCDGEDVYAIANDPTTFNEYPGHFQWLYHRASGGNLEALYPINPASPTFPQFDALKNGVVTKQYWAEPVEIKNEGGRLMVQAYVSDVPYNPSGISVPLRVYDFSTKPQTFLLEYNAYGAPPEYKDRDTGCATSTFQVVGMTFQDSTLKQGFKINDALRGAALYKAGLELPYGLVSNDPADDRAQACGGSAAILSYKDNDGYHLSSLTGNHQIYTETPVAKVDQFVKTVHTNPDSSVITGLLDNGNRVLVVSNGVRTEITPVFTASDAFVSSDVLYVYSPTFVGSKVTQYFQPRVSGDLSASSNSVVTYPCHACFATRFTLNGVATPFTALDLEHIQFKTPDVPNSVATAQLDFNGAASQKFQVTLVNLNTSSFTAGGITSNAFNAPPGPLAAIAPGTILTVYGAQFSDQGYSLTGPLPLPTTLGQTQVEFEGAGLAGLFYVGQAQINLLVPDTVPVGGLIRLRIIRNGIPSNWVSIPVVEMVPGIYATIDTQGRVVDQGSQVPVAAGDYVSIYLTGLGLVNADGTCKGIVQIYLGAYLQGADWCGQVSPGLYQVNVQIPLELAPRVGVEPKRVSFDTFVNRAKVAVATDESFIISR